MGARSGSACAGTIANNADTAPCGASTAPGASRCSAIVLVALLIILCCLLCRTFPVLCIRLCCFGILCGSWVAGGGQQASLVQDRNEAAPGLAPLTSVPA